MAVRNFWIDADIDGRATNLQGGAASKTGGMTVTIKQRSEGCITTVSDSENNLIYKHTTIR